MKLDPSTKEFRAAGHRLVDWIADYLENIDDYDVLSPVKPGDIEKQFPAGPSSNGRSYDELIADFTSKIVPGITHWNHPAFFAYFSITGSQAGILAELLTAAINANGMLWKTSPALTELETVVLRWLRDCLGLPKNLFGIINDTASINSFLALAAAREALGLNIRGEGMTGRNLPPLRVYCSEHAHSSIEKGALALGFGANGVVKIPSDDAYRMRVDALAIVSHAQPHATVLARGGDDDLRPSRGVGERVVEQDAHDLRHSDRIAHRLDSPRGQAQLQV